MSKIVKTYLWQAGLPANCSKMSLSQTPHQQWCADFGRIDEISVLITIGETSSDAVNGHNWLDGAYMTVKISPIPLSFLDDKSRNPTKLLSPNVIAQRVASKRASLIGALIHEIAHAAGTNAMFSHTALDDAAKAVDPKLGQLVLDTKKGENAPYFNEFLTKYCGLKQDFY